LIYVKNTAHLNTARLVR